jgi:hypothetical protein
MRMPTPISVMMSRLNSALAMLCHEEKSNIRIILLSFGFAPRPYVTGRL